MRASTLIALSSTLALLGSGCFAISDLGRFQQDRGCDLDLNLQGFTPHADDLLEVRAVKVNDADPTARPFLGARAILDPMGSINAHIVMFDAVPPGHTALEFYSDEGPMGGNRAYDDPPVDHVWRVDGACVPMEHDFVHQFDFVRLMEPTPIGEDFSMSLTDMNADSNALEVRVISMPPTGVDDPPPARTVGLYRIAAVDDTAVPCTVSGATADCTITIPGIIDTGASYMVTIWSDSSGDGFYDAPPVDESWAISAQLGSTLTSLTFVHVPDFNEIPDNVVIVN